VSEYDIILYLQIKSFNNREFNVAAAAAAGSLMKCDKRTQDNITEKKNTVVWTALVKYTLHDHNTFVERHNAVVSEAIG